MVDNGLDREMGLDHLPGFNGVHKQQSMRKMMLRMSDSIGKNYTHFIDYLSVVAYSINLSSQLTRLMCLRTLSALMGEVLCFITSYLVNVMTVFSSTQQTDKCSSMRSLTTCDHLICLKGPLNSTCSYIFKTKNGFIKHIR